MNVDATSSGLHRALRLPLERICGNRGVTALRVGRVLPGVTVLLRMSRRRGEVRRPCVTGRFPPYAPGNSHLSGRHSRSAAPARHVPHGLRIEPGRLAPPAVRGRRGRTHFPLRPARQTHRLWLSRCRRERSLDRGPVSSDRFGKQSLSSVAAPLAEETPSPVEGAEPASEPAVTLSAAG